MKKIFKGLFVFISCILLVGCFNNNDVLTKFSDRVENAKGYHILGELEVYNNEDKYTYDVEASYFENEHFRVSLKNTVNDHEQIILRNDEGVFVLTPSLNKSFKFQSEWPYNSSQIYLLQTILRDLEDGEKEIEETENEYIVKTKVDYSSNSNLVNQKIYFDKDSNLKHIEILDDNDNIQMKMTFNTIDYNATYDTSYFALNNNMKEVETEVTSKIDSVIYPMFLPDNTNLINQEKVSLNDGERVILTFGGDSSFTIIQETIGLIDEHVTMPTSGNIEFITGTLGTVSETSVSWVNNGIEFYVVSDDLDSEQLLKVANSINSVTVSK